MKNAEPEQDFQRIQAKFSAYIRDPFNNLRPADVKPERMAAYRELFFNNVESFLSSNFPVLKTLLTASQWLELVQDFFAHHTCSTPYFSEIPEEFIHFLHNERDNPNDFPFLIELAHYEWVEMALSIAQEILPAPSANQEPIGKQAIRLSPLAWPLAYQFPVHKISPQFTPSQAPEQATFLIVYRDYDDEVHFIEINGLTYQLLQTVKQQPDLPAITYLQTLAEKIAPDTAQAIIEHGLKTLQEMQRKQILFLSSSCI